MLTGEVRNQIDRIWDGGLSAQMDGLTALLSEALRGEENCPRKLICR